MQIAPRAQMEAHARAEYKKHFSAPAKVRNAQALVALGEHRALRWRSHAYKVPPVPFRDGARLLVASQVLRHARDGDAAGEQALFVARVVMHDLVRRRRFTRRGLRIRRAWLRPRRNPFLAVTAAEAVQLIDWFLDVPDETPQVSGPPAKVIDLKRGFMEAGRLFPFCFDAATGLPHSWLHYQYALREIAAVDAKEELAAARAARNGVNMPKLPWKQYARELDRISGVH